MAATQPAQLVSPAVASTRPSGSGVTVGYQRGKAIGATRDHARVTGSKIFVSRSPVLAPRCPPATNALPSGNRQWPVQNMLVVLGTEVKTPVVGFQRRAWLPTPCPSQARISPVGSRFAWTATKDQASGAAHRPVVESLEGETVTVTGALVVLFPARSIAV